ncbi:hypothetical protein [Halodesulfovibrio sp.]|jgi:hypothetical protein|uniref:hypothetical protein n=1 Tax=Halodesulfovibrio sp. TaxID=1912772 RepID=UPI0025FF8DE6|nr:hypothetical protein [Halodesulfovibrio sp.]MCT4534652.1 hypothetical protein [Halodesulfovibrio sp.]
MKISTAPSSSFSKKGIESKIESQKTPVDIETQLASSEKLIEYTPTTIERVSLTNSMGEISDVAKLFAQTTAERNALIAQGYDKYEAGRKVAKKYMGKLDEETKRKIAAEAEKTANNAEESNEKDSEKTDEEVIQEVVTDPSTGKQTIKVKTIKKVSATSTHASVKGAEIAAPKVNTGKGARVDIDV